MKLTSRAGLDAFCSILSAVIFSSLLAVSSARICVQRFMASMDSDPELHTFEKIRLNLHMPTNTMAGSGKARSCFNELYVFVFVFVSVSVFVPALMCVPFCQHAAFTFNTRIVR